MTAKEYLQQLQRLNTMINQKIKELDDLRSMSTSVGSFDYSKERVQTSPSGDAPFTKIMNKIVTLDEEINREIDFYVDEKHRIINQIQALQNPVHIQVLYKRYVELKHLKVISVELNYTYQYTKELHGYALKAFEKTYPNLL